MRTGMMPGLFRLGWAALTAAFIGSSMAAEVPAEVMQKLADEQFNVREAAQEELLKWGLKHGDQAAALLFESHRSSNDPEVRIRCMEVLKSIAKEGYAKDGKGFIGIQMRDEMIQLPGKNENHAAIRITFILPGLAAERAGLKVGDLVVGINGKHWDAPATDAMREEVMDMKPATKITMQILRDDKVEDIEVTLVKRPIAADNPMLERMPGRLADAEKKAWEEYFQKWKEKHDPGA